MIKTFYFKNPHQNAGTAIDDAINAWAVDNNMRILSTSSGGYDLDLVIAHLFVTVVYEPK